MTISNYIKAGLVGLCLAMPMGCNTQNVSIQRLDTISAEKEPEYLIIEGKVLSSEYTSRSHGSKNQLSLVVIIESKPIVCYIQGSELSDYKQNRNYNLASSIVKSAIQNDSKAKITGKRTPEYFEIKSIEANGFKIDFGEN